VSPERSERITTFVLSRVSSTRSGQAEEQKLAPALSPGRGLGIKTASPTCPAPAGYKLTLRVQRKLWETLPEGARAVGLMI
jgi:hypothetical protein